MRSWSVGVPTLRLKPADFIPSRNLLVLLASLSIKSDPPISRSNTCQRGGGGGGREGERGRGGEGEGGGEGGGEGMKEREKRRGKGDLLIWLDIQKTSTKHIFQISHTLEFPVIQPETAYLPSM